MVANAVAVVALPVNEPTKVVAVAVPATCNSVVGVPVPMPTFPVASTTNGVESVSVPSSLIRSDKPVPALVAIMGTVAAEVPDTVAFI
ncbi:MAG: hypothetical protein ACREAL_09300, partial [Nitrosopumilaceae archaeon]